MKLRKRSRGGHGCGSRFLASSGEPVRIGAALFLVKAAWSYAAYASFVEILALGLITISGSDRTSAIGVIVSPTPVACAQPPVRKNGTSAPREAAMPDNSSLAA